jgi:FKBP-type peptidyl-prolyl cis-trans isomerase FklB
MMSVVNPPLLYSYGILLLFLFPRDLSSFPRQSFTQRSVADMLPATLYPKKGNTMTPPTFDTIEAQASYGIGLQVGQQLSESGLEGLLPEALVAGIADALEGKHPAVPVDVVHRALREIHERADTVRRQRFQAMAAEGVKYLEENAKKEGVNSTESGLQFRVINQGEGAIPARTDRVRVHYTGKLIDGTVFDSSVARGEPAEFPVNGVIPGWIEALTLMPVGSKWELTIPQELAYGERGAGASIPPFSTLVFEVELLEIL